MNSPLSQLIEGNRKSRVLFLHVPWVVTRIRWSFFCALNRIWGRGQKKPPDTKLVCPVYRNATCWARSSDFFVGAIIVCSLT